MRDIGNLKAGAGDALRGAGESDGFGPGTAGVGCSERLESTGCFDLSGVNWTLEEVAMAFG